MLDKIPQEVFQQVVQTLEPAGLKALRLVNRSFSRDVSPALFRTIDVSCPSLDRLRGIAHHPFLSTMVEELHYHEWQFDAVGGDGSESQNYPSNKVKYLWDHMNEFNQQCVRVDPKWTQPHNSHIGEFLANDLGIPLSSSLEEVVDTHPIPPDLSREQEFGLLMNLALDTYVKYGKAQELLSLSDVFCENLPLLPKLRRVVSIDVRSGGIARSCTEMDDEPALQKLYESFPLDDAAIRTWFEPSSSCWPGQGFLAALAVLSSGKATDIRHLEIRRDDALSTKCGIPIEGLDVVYHNFEHEVTVSVFEKLQTLKMCLSVQREPTASKFLLKALAAAPRLRLLEISLTSLTRTYTTLGNILPLTSLPELHTAVLEEFLFGTNEICGWLFLQPKLKNLALRRARLTGRWKDLARKWSKQPNFSLDSFELTSPSDHDNAQFEEGDAQDLKVARRVANEDILRFINHGGENPFENRQWKKFARQSDASPSFSREDWEGDENMDDSLSDYSDISAWLPEDHPEPSDDPDGPEFDEDYDFDAEDDSDDPDGSVFNHHYGCDEEESDLEMGGT